MPSSRLDALGVNNFAVRDIVKRALIQGFEVSRNGSGHLRYSNPKTGQSVTGCSTPSDSRSILNDISALKKIGFEDLAITDLRRKKKMSGNYKPQREATAVNNMVAFLSAHPGQEFTYQELADQVGCSYRTACTINEVRNSYPLVLQRRRLGSSRKPVVLVRWDATKSLNTPQVEEPDHEEPSIASEVPQGLSVPLEVQTNGDTPPEPSRAVPESVEALAGPQGREIRYRPVLSGDPMILEAISPWENGPVVMCRDVEGHFWLAAPVEIPYALVKIARTAKL